MTKTILVTGISGFVAKHCALEFLKAGYNVRGTVRDRAKIDEVVRALSSQADTLKLEFFNCDLLADEGWDAAVMGCDCVAHVASPNPVVQPNDENKLIRPAVDGTLRVMEASLRAGVKRFVLTSSIFATFYGRGHDKEIYDETDWANPDGPGATPYSKSKTLAERAARDFINEKGEDIWFATINPGYIFGPMLDKDLSSSIELIRLFMAGKYPGAPKLCIPFVDVRDVAKAHLRAMETTAPSGGRYLAVSGSAWMIEITKLLHEQMGAHGRRAPRIELPNWLVWLIGMVDPAAHSICAELGHEVSFDNRSACQELSMDFLPLEEAIISSAKSLVELKLV